MEAQESINLQEAETEATNLCGKIFKLGKEISTIKNSEKLNPDIPDYLFDNIGGSSLDLNIKNDEDIIINGTKPVSYSLGLIQSGPNIDRIEMYDFDTGYGYFIVSDKKSKEILKVITSENAKKNEKNETVSDSFETIRDVEETINEKACISVYTTLLPKIQTLLQTIQTNMKDEIDAKLHQQKEATTNAIIDHIDNFKF